MKESPINMLQARIEYHACYCIWNIIVIDSSHKAGYAVGVGLLVLARLQPRRCQCFPFQMVFHFIKEKHFGCLKYVEYYFAVVLGSSLPFLKRSLRCTSMSVPFSLCISQIKLC